MSDNLDLSPESVDLLLRLIELPEPFLAAAGAELYADATAQLVDSGLLLPHDYEDVVASADDHDVPLSLTWCAETGSFTYFSSTAGPVRVSDKRRLRHRVILGHMLTAMTVGLDLSGGAMFELIQDLVWEVGDARFENRKTRLPVWFARRLWDHSVQQQVAELAHARPNTRLRVVLTSSHANRVRGFSIPGAAVVSIHDVLARPHCLLIDQQILAARLGSVPANATGGPIVLSPDGKKLRINGSAPISFRSDPQIAAIRHLVDAFPSGTGVSVSELTDHGSLRRLFGGQKWKLLSPFLKSTNGRWHFEP